MKAKQIFDLIADGYTQEEITEMEQEEAAWMASPEYQEELMEMRAMESMERTSICGGDYWQNDAGEWRCG